MWIGIKMEIPIWIGINTIPIHNNGMWIIIGKCVDHSWSFLKAPILARFLPVNNTVLHSEHGSLLQCCGSGCFWAIRPDPDPDPLGRGCSGSYSDQQK
jgi:hypothetical protein